MTRLTELLTTTAGILAASALPVWAETTVGISVSPSSMDPQLGALGSDEAYYRHIYDPLILSNADLQPSPALITEWTVIDDTTWEMKLREGVKFHDGSDFDAKDVLATLERLPTVPGSDGLNAEKMSAIKEVEVLNPHLIRLHTEVPTPDLLTLLYTAFVISDELPEDVTTEDFNSGEAAIGTGPYSFVSWDRGQAVRLEGNPDYWDGTPDAVDVTLREMPDDSARVAALLAGDVDIIDGVPPLDVGRLKQNSDIKIVSGPSARTIFLQFNTVPDQAPMTTAKDGSPLDGNPLRDVRVREAISLAINQPLIIERIMEGLATPINQPVPSGFMGTDDSIGPVEYDPEKARALLAEAGYGEGFAMTLGCPNDRYVNDAKVCQAVGQMLAAVGIDLTVDTMPKSVYFERMRKGEFPFFMLGWGNAQGNSGSMLRSVLVTKDAEAGFGSWNGGFSDPEADKQLKMAEQLMDLTERDAELAKATRMFMDAQALVPLHAQNVIVALRGDLGYTTMPDEAFRAHNITK